MKTTYKILLSTALGTLVCVFLAFPASAQHRPETGGGGGSSPAPARSSGGGGSVSRPSGFSRPSISPRSPGAQQSGVRSGFSQRNSRVGVAGRPNNYRPGVVGARGNFAPRTFDASHRPVVGAGGSAYRSSPRIGYGKGGYWGNHNYYHYSHGYYNSYYLPRLGFSIGVLPYGYYPFYYGDFQYYYSDGLFYQYDNSQYTVVEPPVGAEVKEVPEKAQSIVINGQQYYELNGVYYQPVTKDDGTTVYEVAGKDGQLNTGTDVQDDQPQGPQMGDVVVQLPPDCRKISVNGEKLFVSPDGVYYQQQADANGNKSYKVVGLPSDEPEQN